MSKYLLLFLVFITSCNHQNNFDREDYLFRYLKEVQHLNIDNTNQLVFIINNKTCNCTGNPNEIIGDNFTRNNLRKLIIMGKSDVQLIDSLSKKITNQKILFDTENKLSDYGLTSSVNFIFEIIDKKIIYWNYMDNESKVEIAKRYNFNN